MLDARRQRKMTEQDMKLLKNRIALLKQEELKTLKRISQANKQAADIYQRKKTLVRDLALSRAAGRFPRSPRAPQRGLHGSRTAVCRRVPPCAAVGEGSLLSVCVLCAPRTLSGRKRRALQAHKHSEKVREARNTLKGTKTAQEQNYVKKELARISKMKAQKRVADEKARLAAQVKESKRFFNQEARDVEDDEYSKRRGRAWAAGGANLAVEAGASPVASGSPSVRPSI